MNPPLTHFPLEDARICLTCDELFRQGPTCPNCASAYFMPLGRWILSTLRDVRNTVPA